MDEQDTLTPEQRAEVQRLHDAFRSEFETARTTTEARQSAALKDLDDIATDALNAIKMGITQRENKKLAVDTARWAYDHLIKQGKGSTDSLEEMLREAEEARRASST